MNPEDFKILIKQIVADPDFSAAIQNVTQDTLSQGILGNQEIRGQLSYQLDDRTRVALKNDAYFVGSATLVSGTVAITNNKIRTTSVAVVSYLTPGGTLGAALKAVPTDGTLTITAVTTGGAAVATDTSIVQFIVIY